MANPPYAPIRHDVGWDQSGYYHTLDPTKQQGLQYFFQYTLDLNAFGLNMGHNSYADTYIGGIGGQHPRVGDSHNFEVFRSTLSTHHLKIKFEGTEWTTAETAFDPEASGTYQWPDLVTEFHSEQQYLEGGLFGCAYPYRVDFFDTSEWNGSSWPQNVWTSKQDTSTSDHFQISDIDNHSEFVTWDDRC